MIVIEVTLYRCNECHTVVAEQGITMPCGPCPNCKVMRGWDELIVREEDD